jgi:hypothetical protein
MMGKIDSEGDSRLSGGVPEAQVGEYTIAMLVCVEYHQRGEPETLPLLRDSALNDELGSLNQTGRVREARLNTASGWSKAFIRDPHAVTALGSDGIRSQTHAISAMEWTSSPQGELVRPSCPVCVTSLV